MIPQAFITAWAAHVPWQTNEQVEQDLVICRALVAIFSDDWLSPRLAFRGGTALHKLYLQPQPRYSEDIDLVQIKSEPIKETVKHLEKALSFLGEASVEQKKNNNTLKFKFESEFPPSQTLRLKVETNCREHFSVFGYEKVPFKVQSEWFTGSCNITTYKLEELLGTKLRALYQRRKGRDLYDLFKALEHHPGIDKAAVLKCYHAYMDFSVEQPPSQKVYLKNTDEKINDDDFKGDIAGLIRPSEQHDLNDAYKIIRKELLEKLDQSKKQAD